VASIEETLVDGSSFGKEHKSNGICKGHCSCYCTHPVGPVIFDRQIAAKQNPLPSRFGTFSGSFWLLVAKAARLWASIKTAPKKKA